MSFFDAMLEATDAFVTGYNAVAGMAPKNNRQMEHGRDGGRGRIERLCRELGWGVDGREGDAIILRFNHAELGTRDVQVVSGDEPLVLFLVYSHAFPAADAVPQQVLGYMLNENLKTPAGCWFADATEDGRAVFGLRYVALGEGLDAVTLKFICEKMVAGASSFDAKMKAAGLLA